VNSSSSSSSSSAYPRQPASHNLEVHTSTSELCNRKTIIPVTICRITNIKRHVQLNSIKSNATGNLSPHSQKKQYQNALQLQKTKLSISPNRNKSSITMQIFTQNTYNKYSSRIIATNAVVNNKNNIVLY